MPITRRRRANPPDQPENNSNHHLADSNETVDATPAVEQSSATAGEAEQFPAASESADADAISQQPPAVSPPPAQPTVTPSPPAPNATNGDHPERHGYSPSSIEGGRRTARGELFRRPPQPPPSSQVHQAAQPAAASTNHAQPQAPSHEISLPLGNLLHLAYNPGYTGSDEARSELLQKLAQESKNGGRARCWNCGSIAIMYDRWNTRSKTFGEVGVAICEICGVWSVM